MLYRTSTQFTQRPSSLVFDSEEINPWLAYTFDRAVLVFGMAVEAEYQNSYDKENHRYTKTIQQILDDPEFRPGKEQPKRQGQARDLMLMFGGKVGVGVVKDDIEPG